MQCKNHPAVEAVDRCTGCAEPFCTTCLVEIQGQKYCGACKVMAVKGTPVVLETEGTIPCHEAGEALKYAIISLFCFGFIFGPIAISKGLKARKEIAADPTLTGGGKAMAGIIIGSVASILWVLSVINRVSSLNGR
jgi:hypothetical protein